MKTFLWYINANCRIIGQGTNKQDALSRLDSSERIKIPSCEFSVEITEHHQKFASYLE